MNGVINIITKSAEDTQGFLFETGYSTNDNLPWAAFRYGDELSDDAWFRVWGKWFDRDGGAFGNGEDFPDDWDALRGGFRVDWRPSSDDEFMFKGNYFKGHAEELNQFVVLTPPYLVPRDQTVGHAGWFLQGRWSHSISTDQDLTLQLYFDHTERHQDLLGQSVDTFDFDFQHRFHLGEDHELIWGVGYRYTADSNDNSFDIFFTPSSRETQLLSAFIQDTITLAEDELFLTIGSKFEHNDFSGFEVQPNVRLLWAPNPAHTLWTAVSRAARTPGRVDHDVGVTLTPIPPMGMIPLSLVTFSGDDGVVSEDVTAFEVGYRVRPDDNLSFDLALFYNHYDNLRTAEVGAPVVTIGPMGPIVFIPATFDNKARGQVYGAELAVQWRVTDNWRLAGSYSYTETDIDPLSQSADPTARSPEDDYPRHQLNVRSYWDVTDELQLNSVIYFVDEIQNRRVSEYLRWDVQVAWQATEWMQVTAGVQNILDGRHDEYGPTLNRPAAEIERLAYLSLEFTF